MFSNVGWGEILLILIVGLILIGPERLPQLITDFRAMVLAARTAIDDARESITGEFGDDFDELRKPLGELGDLRKLNPRTAITRTLFEGDDTYLDFLSGKPVAGTGSADAAGAAGAIGTGDSAANSAGGPDAGAQSNSGGATTAGGQQMGKYGPIGQMPAMPQQNPTAQNPRAQNQAAQNQAAQNPAAPQPGAQQPAGNPGEQGGQAGGFNWADDDVL